MNEKIKIRVHHLMCLRYFRNKGYSDDFCKNMAKIKQLLESQDNIELVDNCDDICSHCPNNVGGKCTSDDVVEYDKKVLDICKNLKIGCTSFQKAYTMVDEEILSEGKRQSICGNCRWNELCKSKN